MKCYKISLPLTAEMIPVAGYFLSSSYIHLCSIIVDKSLVSLNDQSIKHVHVEKLAMMMKSGNYCMANNSNKLT